MTRASTRSTRSKSAPAEDRKLAPVAERSILDVAQSCMLEYGTYVVEQRAVADYRDGLKPVHRVILWACYKLGLRGKVKPIKSARTVGDVIGKYHPHGDTSVYDAMIGIAGTKSTDGTQWVSRNCAVPLVEGFGNWGDNIDRAAAYRYTEARLSEFASNYLLDPLYLKVSDYVKNFSDDEDIPIVLPAKLPVLLLNGSTSIAVGINAKTPAFESAGVIAVCKQLLAGEKVTHLSLAKTLKFNPTYGGICVSPKEEILSFFKTGQGSIKFKPVIEVETNRSSSIIRMVGSCPGLTTAGSVGTLEDNLLKLPEVDRVVDCSDNRGFVLEIMPKRGIKDAALDDLLAKVTKLMTKSESYDIGVTERTAIDAKFKRSTVLEIFTSWTTWRIDLEVKAINYLIQEEQRKKANLELLLLAVVNLSVIMQALSSKVKDSEAFLMSKLKITKEQATFILDLRVRQLKAMEQKRLKEEISAIVATITALKKDLKTPAARVLAQLSSGKSDVSQF